MTETTTSIRKPMLSGKAPTDLSTLVYPVFCTPKIDGIRALMVDGKLVSRTFKEIRNDHIRTTLESFLPDGIDGELFSGANFQSTTSGVMRKTGKTEFVFCAFDYVKDDPTKSYTERMKDLQDWFDESQPENVVLLLPKTISNEDELLTFEVECLADGYEGVMIRSADGGYKMGRATTREATLLKLKRFDDAEAEVIGFEELMHNNNVAEQDAFGRTKRSQHQENKVGAGVLGKLVCRDLTTGIEFGCGTGFSAEERKKYWEERDSLVGKFISYKSFNIGVKEAPRHPVWLRFREDDFDH